MKTRDVIVLCAAMVTGAASITAAEPVAAKLSPQTMMLAQATPAPAAGTQAKKTTDTLFRRGDGPRRSMSKGAK